MKTVLTNEKIEELAKTAVNNVEGNYVRRFLKTFSQCDLDVSYAFKMLEYDADKHKLSNQTMRAVRAGIRYVI